MDALELSTDSHALSWPATDLRERLTRLRSIPGIVGSESADPAAVKRASVPLLFSLLPPGIPRGAVTELSGPDGGGKTEAAIRVLAENPDIRAAWVEDLLSIYPCAFPQFGVPIERVLFAEPGRDFLWTVHQILRSQIFPLVVVRPPQALGELDLRRLQLSAERARSSLILLNEQPTLKKNWPIRVQVEITRCPADHSLQARLLTLRGRSPELTTTARKVEAAR